MVLALAQTCPLIFLKYPLYIVKLPQGKVMFGDLDV